MRKLLIAAGVALVATLACGAQTTASGPYWLQTLHDSNYSEPNHVGKFCDTETGNLVYLYGDYRGGIAVIQGGCKQ